MPLWQSPVAVHLLLNEEGSRPESKRTPGGKVRFLIYEVSGLDMMTCRVQEDLRNSLKPRRKSAQGKWNTVPNNSSVRSAKT